MHNRRSAEKIGRVLQMDRLNQHIFDRDSSRDETSRKVILKCHPNRSIITIAI